MWDKLSDALMNVAFAGVGAAAIVVEKAGEVGKVLVEKGEVAVEQGRQLNDELQEKAKAAAKERQEQRINDAVAALTAQERQELRAKLDVLDQAEREAEEAARAAEEAAEKAAEESISQAGNITQIHCDSCGCGQDHTEE